MNTKYKILNTKYGKKGFTIIELIVTIGIFTLMTSVVLSNYRSFNINVDFINTVENVILVLRESQVYGAGGKKAGDSVVCPPTPATAFNCAYGVNFVNGSGSYDFFVDTNVNSIMDAGELIQTILLGNSTTITSLLCVRSGSPGVCVNNYASITFKRPSPDAVIVETPSPVNSLDGVDITISNGIKTVIMKISSAGQMSIQ